MKGTPMIKNNRDILGEMKRRGVTVTALAEAMGMSRTTLSMRLNQRDTPEPTFLSDVLMKIKELEQ